MTEHRGRKHDYLGMNMISHKDGILEIEMKDYLKGMIDTFPIKFHGDKITTPAADNLFAAGKGNKLGKEKAEMFHKMVAKALFVSARARVDLQPTVAVLSTRTKEPTNDDWLKLIKFMKYLTATKELTRRIDTNGDLPSLSILKWMIDASFAVHPDMRSHTGGVGFIGDNNRGAIQTLSRKQKLNTKSSTEAELVGVDDMSVMVLWTQLFLEEQGWAITKNIIYQDNKSAILLETNGKKSSGKRTRAINIRYYFITDHVVKGTVSIEYCPTDLMIGDYMTKPNQGRKFITFRKNIMNHKGH